MFEGQLYRRISAVKGKKIVSFLLLSREDGCPKTVDVLEMNVGRFSKASDSSAKRREFGGHARHRHVLHRAIRAGCVLVARPPPNAAGFGTLQAPVPLATNVLVYEEVSMLNGSLLSQYVFPRPNSCRFLRYPRSIGTRPV